MDSEFGDAITRAADSVRAAEGLLVCAGAGMGVDSGLPDFRGDEGFWRAYPPLKQLGISFVEMANPGWFGRDPTLAWGFYGHRFNLYRDTRPHGGFAILERWGRTMDAGAFVFTSNVDGHFQRTGFDEESVYECHGSIRHLQCCGPCGDAIWAADSLVVTVDESTFRAADPLPACPSCGDLARPNVLMFGDWSWVPHRSHAQEVRFSHWLHGVPRDRLVVVELGAGTAVPTVRCAAERAVAIRGGTLIRINTREAQVPRGHLGFAAGALDTLTAIDDALRG